MPSSEPVAIVEEIFEAELLAVVITELPELDTQVRWRCLTELLGLMVFKPLNLIACEKQVRLL